MLWARSKCSLISFLCHCCLSVCLSLISLSSVCLSVYLPTCHLSACLFVCLSFIIHLYGLQGNPGILAAGLWVEGGGLAAGVDLVLPFSLPPLLPMPLLTHPSPSAAFLVSEPGRHGPPPCSGPRHVLSSINTPHPCLTFTHRDSSLLPPSLPMKFIAGLFILFLGGWLTFV